MNIVEPFARIQYHPNTRSHGILMLQEVERAARVSHRSEERMDENSWERFIKAVVLEHGDWSVTEHQCVTVEALVDRGITHEWVRHRIGSYTQESTRFVNYEKNMPPAFICPFSRHEPFGDRNALVGIESPLTIWEDTMEIVEAAYRRLISEFKVAPQIARSIFPNSLASKLIVTYNLRSWRHFFIMRTTKEAHPQMKQVTISLLEQFKERIPLLYDDIIPGARQIDNMRLPR